MASKRLLHISLALLTLLLAACAQDRVILLPQPDGSPSAVLFQPKRGGQAILAQPYATVESSRNYLSELLNTPNELTTHLSDPAEVARRYKALADALPMRPKTFIVYFESGEGRLTAESEARMAEILAALKSLPAPELVITGHTDSVGSISANDQISEKRAEIIRNRLIEQGVPAKRMEAIGRGKRQLLIPTADGVPEAQNRRVEIRLK